MVTRNEQPQENHPFDADAVLRDIGEQCAFGPRVPGTKGHGACRDWIEDQIAAAGWFPWKQSFEACIAITSSQVTAHNVWGLPKAPDAMAEAGAPLLVLSAHWDTRAIADEDPPGEERRACPGANDGGSGVAMALELARCLKSTVLWPHLVLAFFDAEDSGGTSVSSWCLGSRYAAKARPSWFGNVTLGVNLDMVAGANLEIGLERTSLRAAPDVYSRLWRIGRQRAPELFATRRFRTIVDDHSPFVEVGIPYIDVISTRYAHWHRSDDTPDKCDREVVQRLGEILLIFLVEELEERMERAVRRRGMRPLAREKQ